MDISRINDWLFVGGQPRATDAAALCDLNVGLIISMRGESRPPADFSVPPLQALWLRTFDTFFTPIPLRLLEQGVRAALPVLAQGRRVLAHCHYGRHRGVAMGAALLIAHGSTAAEAMRLLRQQREAADPHIWYIRRQIERFEQHWHALVETSRP